MFGKLLRHDFQHYLKLWLFGALTAIVMSFVGGFCQPRSEWMFKHDHMFFGLFFTLVTIVSIICIVAFYFLTLILFCMRYAKNCFSDEGYLTFTLPVKRISILNAKLVSAFIYNLLAAVISAGCFLIFFCVSNDRFFFEASYVIHNVWREIHLAVGNYIYAYLILGLIIAVLTTMLFINFVFFSITIAGIKVKKNKLIAGIGIYYLCNVIISFITQLGAFAAFFIASARLNDSNAVAAVLIMLGILAVWIFGANAALYYKQLHLLENKLNLA